MVAPPNMLPVEVRVITTALLLVNLRREVTVRLVAVIAMQLLV